MSEKPFDNLKPMTTDVVPIVIAERQGRIEKARRLMAENHIDAIYLEAGSSLFYFTGIRWGRSERMTAAVIPAEGEIAYVCPAFEEARLRELIQFGDDVRVWEEDESPYDRVAQLLKEWGIDRGKIAIEESVRFFLYDGIRQRTPRAEFVSADPVTIPCRAIKSSVEIALIQRAMDITIGPASVVCPATTLRAGSHASCYYLVFRFLKHHIY